jgi:hypothetical protein
MIGARVSLAFGYPDYDLLTMTEMVSSAAHIVRAVDLPVVADADAGYGNRLNVVRSVREYRAASPAFILRTRSRLSAVAIWTTRQSYRNRNGPPNSVLRCTHGVTRIS